MLRVKFRILFNGDDDQARQLAELLRAQGAYVDRGTEGWSSWCTASQLAPIVNAMAELEADALRQALAGPKA
jgi:hypothetical protein